MSVLGVAIWNWHKAILAFWILVGPPAEVLGLHLSNTKPSIKVVSSMVPPNFLTILMSFKSIFVAVFGSITFITAWTANGENSYSADDDKTFELSEVLTHYFNVSVLVI